MYNLFQNPIPNLTFLHSSIVRIWTILLFVGVIYPVFSQEDSIAKHQVYLEGGGSGGYGSLNYERIVHAKNKYSLALRFGIGTYHVTDYTNKLNPDIILPIMVNAYYGQNHKMELGVGQSFISVVQHDANFKADRVSNLNTLFSIGYRYQKSTGGILFRFAYTPIIEYNKHFRNWFGISIGYTFK